MEMTATDDKRILVTGGSGGIGGAIATRLAADGHAVLVHYRSNFRAIDLTDLLLIFLQQLPEELLVEAREDLQFPLRLLDYAGHSLCLHVDRLRHLN